MATVPALTESDLVAELERALDSARRVARTLLTRPRPRDEIVVAYACDVIEQLGGLYRRLNPGALGREAGDRP